MCDDKLVAYWLLTRPRLTHIFTIVEIINRPNASFGDEIFCKNITDTLCGFCTQLLRNGTEREPNTAASHLMNPLTLFQHMEALFTYFGNSVQKVEQLQIQFSRLERTLQGTHSGHLNTGGSRELHPVSRANLDRLIQRAQPSLVQASISYNAREVEHLQPSSIRVLQNGSYVWRIDDVSQYQQSTAAIRSSPFLTAHTGYKMCIEAYFNGDGTSLSLRFILMKGEYDPLLKWPFDCTVTFLLIDQTHREHIWYRFQPDRDSPSFHRPQSDSNIPYNVPRFTELSILTDTRYVKDDVMFIKCIVDTTNVFHP